MVVNDGGSMYWKLRYETMLCRINMCSGVVKYSRYDIEPSREIINQIGDYLIKNRADLVNHTYANDSYRKRTAMRVIYNDYVCIANTLPGCFAIFGSDLGFKKPNFGKGFETAINMIVKYSKSRIKIITGRDHMIIKNVPLKLYYPFIVAILRDDDVPFVPPKSKTPKYPVRYWPIKYDPEYAKFINSVAIVTYKWAIKKLDFHVTKQNNVEGWMLRDKKDEIYRNIYSAIDRKCSEEFINECINMCAYDYIWEIFEEHITRGYRFQLYPIPPGSIEKIYLFKAYMALLKEEEPVVFRYLMRNTQVFQEIEFEGYGYDVYMRRYQSWYQRKNKPWKVHATYDEYDPRWTKSEPQSRRFLEQSDKSVQETIDHLFLDQYRRTIYDQETYDDYYNFDAAHTERY